MSRRLPKIFYFLSFAGTAYGAMVLTRTYVSGKDYKSEATLYGKVAIVTGANAGVGKEVAKDLSKRGARVIMACRDMDKCSKAKQEIIDATFNKNIECVECNLASLESIKNFTEQIKKKEKFVHILVNNAGIMWCPKSFTKEGFEMHLGVNYLGPFYLTYLLLDLIKYSAPSRIINVSCKAYVAGRINFDDLNSSKNYNERTAYNQSKLATVLFTQKLSELLKNSNVSVFTSDPGVVQTDILRHSSYYKSSFSNTIIGPFFKTFMKTPAKGAESISYCCVEPGLEDKSGKYFRNAEECEIHSNALNKEDAQRLWAIGERWTRLK